MSFPQFTFTVDGVKTPIRSPRRPQRYSPAASALSSQDVTPWGSGARSARTPRRLRDPTPQELKESGQDALQRMRDRNKRQQAEKELSDFMNRGSMLQENEYTESMEPYRSIVCTPRERSARKHSSRSADLDRYLEEPDEREHYDIKIRESNTIRGRAERDLYFSKYGPMNARRSLEPPDRSRHGGQDRRDLRRHKKSMERRRSSSLRR